MLSDRNNVDVVVLATYLVGGAIRKVDTEDIAVKAHEIAPGRFSWKKYPEQIDIERVRVRLSQARTQSMLVGVHSEGWRLTAPGTEYVKNDLLRLERQGRSKTSIGKADRQWMAAERKRLLATKAYQKFVNGQSSAISNPDVREFFRVDEYVSPEIRQTKLDRLLGAFGNDARLGQLLTILADRLEQGKI